MGTANSLNGKSLLHRSQLVPLGLYLSAQAEEAVSDLNRHGSWEEFGHNPTPNELWEHYINSGRAAEMPEVHSEQTIALVCQQHGMTREDFKQLLKDNSNEAERLLKEAFALVVWLTGEQLKCDPRKIDLLEREAHYLATYRRLLNGSCPPAPSVEQA